RRLRRPAARGSAGTPAASRGWRAPASRRSPRHRRPGGARAAPRRSGRTAGAARRRREPASRRRHARGLVARVHCPAALFRRRTSNAGAYPDGMRAMGRIRRSRKTAAVRCVLPLVVAAYVLCGCGGGGDPLSQVKASAQKTIGVHWLRYQLAFDRPRLFEPSLQVAGGRAVFNVDARLGYEVLTLRERGGGSRLLWLDVTPTAFLVDLDLPLVGVLPAGKIWISAGYSGANAVAAQAEGLSAELPLDEIAWGAQTATRIRTSVVGHVPMAEYRVVVDLTKALSAARTAHLRSIAAAI